MKSKKQFLVLIAFLCGFEGDVFALDVLQSAYGGLNRAVRSLCSSSSASSQDIPSQQQALPPKKQPSSSTPVEVQTEKPKTTLLSEVEAKFKAWGIVDDHNFVIHTRILWDGGNSQARDFITKIFTFLGKGRAGLLTHDQMEKEQKEGQKQEGIEFLNTSAVYDIWGVLRGFLFTSYADVVSQESSLTSSFLKSAIDRTKKDMRGRVLTVFYLLSYHEATIVETKKAHEDEKKKAAEKDKIAKMKVSMQTPEAIKDAEQAEGEIANQIKKSAERRKIIGNHVVTTACATQDKGILTFSDPDIERAKAVNESLNPLLTVDSVTKVYDAMLVGLLPDGVTEQTKEAKRAAYNAILKVALGDTHKEVDEKTFATLLEKKPKVVKVAPEPQNQSSKKDDKPSESASKDNQQQKKDESHDKQTPQASSNASNSSSSQNKPSQQPVQQLETPSIQDKPDGKPTNQIASKAGEDSSVGGEFQLVDNPDTQPGAGENSGGNNNNSSSAPPSSSSLPSNK